jgi:hypothetical protein
MYAVDGGRLAGQDRRVGGQGNRRRRNRLLEDDSLAGQGIDIRRIGTVIAIGSDPVGAGRVEADEKDPRRDDAFRPARRATSATVARSSTMRRTGCASSVATRACRPAEPRPYAGKEVPAAP